MKKTYIKPQTSAMELEIESLMDATSLTINTNKTLDTDTSVGAKHYTSEDLWGMDDEE